MKQLHAYSPALTRVVLAVLHEGRIETPVPSTAIGHGCKRLKRGKRLKAVFGGESWAREGEQIPAVCGVVIVVHVAKSGVLRVGGNGVGGVLIAVARGATPTIWAHSMA
jgi:hypothetical protein